MQNNRNHASLHTEKKLMNPFAAILHCEKCGATMKRNVPDKRKHTSPWYRCPTRSCDCRTVKCDLVENGVIKAMKEWLGEYTVEVAAEQATQTNPLESALTTTKEQLELLYAQQDSVCGYLEKGVYTVEMFTKRNEAIERDIRKLRKTKEELEKKMSEQCHIQNTEADIVPTTQHILDNYDGFTPAEKNELWKKVMEKITVYRAPNGETSLHIYPKLQKKN
ncbi:MAG: zinc ribbon domain-containing protein [Lachnospiraceae bacterium]|nr:zinc ribbon domain-containing protein [Lachnospiraceae bacterium]